MSPDPIAQFHRWFASASKNKEAMPNACALATADLRGRPSVRFVLLKGADKRGFVFYTHTDSRKGRELGANPRAALAFYWDKAGRQVRVSGSVRRVLDSEADAYWKTRPRLSQVGAWASAQSAPLDSRAALLARAARTALKYRGKPVPRPPTWTGFRVSPQAIEFWTRKSFRMHHRELFVKKGNSWKRLFLQP